MALNGDQLAVEMSAAMGYSFTSSYLKAFGKGIVLEVKKGVATHSGFPGPHTISGVSGPNMASTIKGLAGYPHVSDQLVKTCNAIADHVMQSGQVFYAAPPPNPMAGDPGWYLLGTITGLSGSALAKKIVDYVGYGNVSQQLLGESTAIVTHIMTNAQVESGVIS